MQQGAVQLVTVLGALAHVRITSNGDHESDMPAGLLKERITRAEDGRNRKSSSGQCVE